MPEPVVEVLTGLWRHVATGNAVRDPKSNEGIVYINLKTWEWCGTIDCFRDQFRKVGEGGDHGED